MDNPFTLQDQHIMVTGGSSGIGRAGARLFSRMGARVALVGRDEERLATALGELSGSGHSAHRFDLAALDDIPAFVKSVAEAHGPLSGLFHAAGTFLIMPARLLKPAQIAGVFASSVEAALMLTRGLCGKGVCVDTGGSLVFMSSVSASVGRPGLSAYGSAKAALCGMVPSLACELAPRGLRVNAIMAGAVAGPMLEQGHQQMSPESIEVERDAHLLGFGRAEDVANAAAFLLSPASRWVTGTTMVVDGGMSCH